MGPHSECYLPRFFVSGETPGTGASTVSKLLSAALEKVTYFSAEKKVPVVSGGKYFRGFALLLAQLEEQNGNYVRLFLEFQELLEKKDFVAIRQKLAPVVGVKVEEPVLKRFQNSIENHVLANGEQSSQWDQIVDHLLVEDALTAEQFVLDAKLAVVLFLIDQIREDFDLSANLWSLPVLKILLHVPLSVASQRATEREQEPVPVEDIVERRNRDFRRYARAYSIDQQPLEHADLARHTNLRINTAELTPPEVAMTILEKYEALFLLGARFNATDAEGSLVSTISFELECQQDAQADSLADHELPDLSPAFAFLESENLDWQRKHSHAA